MFTLDKRSLGSVPLVEGTLYPNNLKQIYQSILSKKHEIYPGCLDNKDYDFIDAVWTSLDYCAFDKFPELKFLLPYLKQSLEMLDDSIDKYYLKSWINIWPQGQSIGYHTHYGTWHGYYVVKDTGTSTYYFPNGASNPIPLKNYDGHFVCTSSKVPHLAQINNSQEFRVSVGFNISTWDEILREESNSKDLPQIKIIENTRLLKDYFND